MSEVGQFVHMEYQQRSSFHFFRLSDYQSEHYVIDPAYHSNQAYSEEEDGGSEDEDDFSSQEDEENDLSTETQYQEQVEESI